MKDNGEMVKKMDLELNIIQMELYLKECGKMEKKKDMEYNII